MFRYLIFLCCLLFSSSIEANNLLLEPIEFPNPLSYEEISQKIQPSITYGIINYDCNGFKKDDVVEILEDVSQGSIYCVKKDNLTTWVYQSALTIIPCTTSTAPPLSSEELEFYINHEGRTSQTSYYLWVDLSRQLVYVFFKQDTMWVLIRQMPCATGKPTTPTVRGTFKILDRGNVLRSDEHVKYWVKFYKNYLFHSLPLTTSNEVLDPRLGEAISNGCVRLIEEDAKWLFDTIPECTTVWVY